MAPRSNDKVGNDHVGKGSTTRGDDSTAGHVNEEYKIQNEVLPRPLNGQLSGELSGELEVLGVAGPVDMPLREQVVVPRAGLRDVNTTTMYEGNAEKKENVVVGILDVESDDEHEEWPEVPLDAHQDEMDDREPCCSSANDGEEHDEKDFDDPATTIDLGDLFLKHKVRQKDTLAGLAVKYNVSISDIKRANGFQTDSALYGKEWVIIPRKPFPIGPEHAAWAGMILAHYEQGISLPLPHGTNIRNYYSGNTSPIRSRDAVEDDNGMLGPGHLLASHHKEVEMMSRSTYKDDRLRRRNIDEQYMPRRKCDSDENDPATRQFFDAMRERDTTPLFSAATTARFNSWREKSVSTLSNGAMRELKDLHSKSIRWRDQLFSKIKKAASQPSMAPASSLKRD